MANQEKPSLVTISFSVRPDVYLQLAERLPNYGERTAFFRTVLDRFLSGQLEVSMVKKF